MNLPGPAELLLAVYLFLDEPPSAKRSDPEAPWPVHRGGLLLKLYSHSLSIALVTLFLACIWRGAHAG
jgi:hypothetical protein